MSVDWLGFCALGRWVHIGPVRVYSSTLGRHLTCETSLAGRLRGLAGTDHDLALDCCRVGFASRVLGSLYSPVGGKTLLVPAEAVLRIEAALCVVGGRGGGAVGGGVATVALEVLGVVEVDVGGVWEVLVAGARLADVVLV